MTTQTTTQILEFIAAYAAGVKKDDNGSKFNISFVGSIDLKENNETYNTSVMSGGRSEKVFVASDSKLVVKKIYSMDDIGYTGGNFRIHQKDIIVSDITENQKIILEEKTSLFKRELIMKRLKEDQAAIEAKRAFFKETKAKIIASYGDKIWSVIENKGFKVSDLLHVAELVSKSVCPINADFKGCETWRELPNWLPKNNLKYVTENATLAVAIQEYAKNKGATTESPRIVYGRS